jgi:hypothetical protein
VVERSSCGTGGSSRSSGRRRPGRSSNDSGSTPKGPWAPARCSMTRAWRGTWRERPARRRLGDQLLAPARFVDGPPNEGVTHVEDLDPTVRGSGGPRRDDSDSCEETARGWTPSRLGSGATNRRSADPGTGPSPIIAPGATALPRPRPATSPLARPSPQPTTGDSRHHPQDLAHGSRVQSSVNGDRRAQTGAILDRDDRTSPADVHCGRDIEHHEPIVSSSWRLAGSRFCQRPEVRLCVKNGW